MTPPSSRARRALSVALAVFGLASPRIASACGSCRGPGGAGSALTAPWQTYGVSVVETMRVGQGVFDQRSRFRPFGRESHDRVLELAFAGAVRPVDAVELGVTAAYGNVLVGGPGFRSSRGALGDLSLRARWEVLQEPPLELTGQQRLPAVGLTFTTRVPSGPVDRATNAGASGPSPGTVGSTATSQGLGTTELAFAVDVRKTFASRFQIGAVGEAAYRAPDESIGLRRALAPRGLVRLMGITFQGDATFALFADLAAEGDVRYGSRTSPDSGQRSVSLGASATYKTPLGARAGLALSYQPPIDGLSKNAVAATGITTFLAFTR
ncbi:MAG TPA: hypothetical protein VM925_02300 [Labilithrix sp.]|nr:hypothetical protein [Labilithrix sp.]